MTVFKRLLILVQTFGRLLTVWRSEAIDPMQGDLSETRNPGEM